MASTEFNWGFQWHVNQPTAELCDIILPAPVWQFEGMDEYMYGHQRFVSGPNGMRNYFTFCARGVDFPGEVRSKEWVWTQIAKRLGDEVAEGYNPRMKDVAWEDWVDAQEAIYQEAFERVGRQRGLHAVPRGTTIVPPGRNSTPTPWCAPR